MRESDLNYVRTKRSGIVHVVNPKNPYLTLCAWSAAYNRTPIPYSEIIPIQLCKICQDKVTSIVKNYQSPKLSRLDWQTFKLKLDRKTLVSVQFEAAKKGHWGVP